MENQKCLKIVMFKPVYLIQLGQNGLLGLNVVKHVEGVPSKEVGLVRYISNLDKEKV